MAKKIKITINELVVEVEQGTSILDAARQIGVIIPTLCYHKDLCVAGNCRVCVIEIVGQKRLSAACATPCEEGMDILTNSFSRFVTHVNISLSFCSPNITPIAPAVIKNGNCELQKLAFRL